MKVFAATLSAILVAAGIFYLIYQDHQRTAAYDALEQDLSLHPVPRYGNSEYLPKPPPPAPDKSLAWIIAPLQIKTSDGLITMRKGAVVRIIPEKSKPGTVVVNYNGYVASIRSDAITQTSK